MFKKNKKIDPNVTDTLIGEGSLFEGHIKSEASLRIEGKINGDIDCTGDVTIGEPGMAKSSVLARNITIAGTVQGNVSAKERLMITSSGKLFGNATVSKSFIIEEGGVFSGTSKMEPQVKKEINKNEELPNDGQYKGQYKDSIANNM